MTRFTGPNLTSHDLVKSVAVLLMLLDHVGYFFYPDNDWYRVFGRGAMPIWAFLIGYATTRDISRSFMGWALALFAVNAVTGGPILPMNILITFMLVRLMIDRAGRLLFSGWEVMIYTTVALVVLSFPSMMVVEYGTEALLIALCGLGLRHRDKLNVSNRALIGFMAFCTIFHAFMQNALFEFLPLEAKASAFVVGAVMFMMYFFKSREFPEATIKMPRFITGALQFSGRYTLEIYAIHLIVFKLIAAQYGLANHGFFDFLLFPE